MRIFISSVRSGLEEERDALPGLVRALGHEPVRFEDFSAQSAPSRQACLDQVMASDAYLLILGPHYGAVFPETGQSPTHDEWIAAEQAGIPRFVFRKTGVDLDVEQQAFLAKLGEYGSGRFYKAFAGAADLQTAVAAVVRGLEVAPSALTYRPLPSTVSVPWLNQHEGPSLGSSREPLLEVHVLPITGASLSARVLEQLEARLPLQVRAAGQVSATEALDVTHRGDGVTLRVPPAARPRGWGETRGGSLAQIRVDRLGRVTVAFRLPGDNMGSLLDSQDLTVRIASALRLAGQLDSSGSDYFAIGVGLSSRASVSVGRATGTARSTVSMGRNDAPLQIDPDESMSRSALDSGADEVAALLTRTLLREFGGER